MISFIVLIVQHGVRALPQVMPHTQSVLPDLKYYRLTWMRRPNMPGRSSAVKEEPVKAGSPPSLLGATGGALGGTGKDDCIIDPVKESPVTSPANATVAEGVRWREKYSLLVRIFTARETWSLKPYAWVEDLLKDFFQSILGVNLSVILLSPTECLIFSGNCNQAMSWDKSLRYAHQLSGIHPWTGYMIEVVALQWTLKEACHEMQVVREFTHERTKQRIAHLNALTAAPTAKAQPTTPQRSPRGHGMTRWADQFFMQQQLREMNFDEPAFAHRPALLGAWPETLENEQFDSTREDAKEDEGGATSMLDSELDASTGARKWMPQGTQHACPQPIGTADGITPWGGSITIHDGNFAGQRIGCWASLCFENLQRRMPSPTGIGIAKSRMPWSRATTPLRWKRWCSHP